MHVPSGRSVLTQADEKSLATTLYLRRGAAATEAEQYYRAKVLCRLAHNRSAYDRRLRRSGLLISMQSGSSSRRGGP